MPFFPDFKIVDYTLESMFDDDEDFDTQETFEELEESLRSLCEDVDSDVPSMVSDDCQHGEISISPKWKKNFKENCNEKDLFLNAYLFRCTTPDVIPLSSHVNKDLATVTKLPSVNKDVVRKRRLSPDELHRQILDENKTVLQNGTTTKGKKSRPIVASTHDSSTGLLKDTSYRILQAKNVKKTIGNSVAKGANTGKLTQECQKVDANKCVLQNQAKKIKKSFGNGIVKVTNTQVCEKVPKSTTIKEKKSASTVPCTHNGPSCLSKDVPYRIKEAKNVKNVIGNGIGKGADPRVCRKMDANKNVSQNSIKEKVSSRPVVACTHNSPTGQLKDVSYKVQEAKKIKKMDSNGIAKGTIIEVCTPSIAQQVNTQQKQKSKRLKTERISKDDFSKGRRKLKRSIASTAECVTHLNSKSPTEMKKFEQEMKPILPLCLPQMQSQSCRASDPGISISIAKLAKGMPELQFLPQVVSDSSCSEATNESVDVLMNVNKFEEIFGKELPHSVRTTEPIRITETIQDHATIKPELMEIEVSSCPDLNKMLFKSHSDSISYTSYFKASLDMNVDALGHSNTPNMSVEDKMIAKLQKKICHQTVYKLGDSLVSFSTPPPIVTTRPKEIMNLPLPPFAYCPLPSTSRLLCFIEANKSLTKNKSTVQKKAGFQTFSPKVKSKKPTSYIETKNTASKKVDPAAVDKNKSFDAEDAIRTMFSSPLYEHPALNHSSSVLRTPPTSTYLSPMHHDPLTSNPSVPVHLPISRTLPIHHKPLASSHRSPIHCEPLALNNPCKPIYPTFLPLSHSLSTCCKSLAKNLANLLPVQHVPASNDSSPVHHTLLDSNDLSPIHRDPLALCHSLPTSCKPLATNNLLPVHHDLGTSNHSLPVQHSSQSSNDAMLPIHCDSSPTPCKPVATNNLWPIHRDPASFNLPSPVHHTPLSSIDSSLLIHHDPLASNDSPLQRHRDPLASVPSSPTPFIHLAMNDSLLIHRDPRTLNHSLPFQCRPLASNHYATNHHKSPDSSHSLLVHHDSPSSSVIQKNAKCKASIEVETSTLTHECKATADQRKQILETGSLTPKKTKEMVAEISLPPINVRLLHDLASSFLQSSANDVKWPVATLNDFKIGEHLHGDYQCDKLVSDSPDVVSEGDRLVSSKLLKTVAECNIIAKCLTDTSLEPHQTCKSPEQSLSHEVHGSTINVSVVASPNVSPKQESDFNITLTKKYVLLPFTMPDGSEIKPREKRCKSPTVYTSTRPLLLSEILEKPRSLPDMVASLSPTEAKLPSCLPSQKIIESITPTYFTNVVQLKSPLETKIPISTISDASKKPRIIPSPSQKNTTGTLILSDVSEMPKSLPDMGTSLSSAEAEILSHMPSHQIKESITPTYYTDVGKVESHSEPKTPVLHVSTISDSSKQSDFLPLTNREPELSQKLHTTFPPKLNDSSESESTELQRHTEANLPFTSTSASSSVQMIEPYSQNKNSVLWKSPVESKMCNLPFFCEETSELPDTRETELMQLPTLGETSCPSSSPMAQVHSQDKTQTTSSSINKIASPPIEPQPSPPIFVSVRVCTPVPSPSDNTYLNEPVPSSLNNIGSTLSEIDCVTPIPQPPPIVIDSSEPQQEFDAQFKTPLVKSPKYDLNKTVLQQNSVLFVSPKASPQVSDKDSDSESEYLVLDACDSDFLSEDLDSDNLLKMPTSIGSINVPVIPSKHIHDYKTLDTVENSVDPLSVSQVSNLESISTQSVLKEELCSFLDNVRDQLPVVEQPKKKVSQPFTSEDPAENWDINNPEWDVVRLLETDEERYRMVRRMWKSNSIPNPHKNLTLQSYRSRRLQSNSPSIGRETASKRKRSPSPEMGRESKRARMGSYPCTFHLDNTIQEQQTDFDVKEEIINKRFSQTMDSVARRFAELEHQVRNRYNFMYPNYLNGLEFDLEIRELRHRENVERHCVMKSQEIARKNLFKNVGENLENLKKAREEVWSFNSFYDGLSPSFAPTLLDNQQISEVLELNNMYDVYAIHYNE